jgi:hypothetical protein
VILARSEPFSRPWWTVACSSCALEPTNGSGLGRTGWTGQHKRASSRSEAWLAGGVLGPKPLWRRRVGVTKAAPSGGRVEVAPKAADTVPSTAGDQPVRGGA